MFMFITPNASHFFDNQNKSKTQFFKWLLLDKEIKSQSEIERLHHTFKTMIIHKQHWFFSVCFILVISYILQPHRQQVNFQHKKIYSENSKKLKQVKE